MICRSHAAQGMQEGAQDIAEEGGLFLERWRDGAEENKPNFIHGTPPRDDLYLDELQGQFVSLDTCNMAVNLSEGLVKLTDDTAKDKDQ